jgi:HSP20 family protein
MYRNDSNDQARLRNPACSICEEGEDIKVLVELPGVAREGLEIKVEGNELSISGKRGDAPAGGSYLLRERQAGDFRKSFVVDDSIDRGSIDARLENGILVLKLKVKEAAKPRRIEIA